MDILKIKEHKQLTEDLTVEILIDFIDKNYDPIDFNTQLKRSAAFSETRTTLTNNMERKPSWSLKYIAANEDWNSTEKLDFIMNYERHIDTDGSSPLAQYLERRA